MKWLSDHKVNIEIRACPPVVYAEMKFGGATYRFCDIDGKMNLQCYLRSVVYRFKRIFKKKVCVAGCWLVTDEIIT